MIIRSTSSIGFWPTVRFLFIFLLVDFSFRCVPFVTGHQSSRGSLFLHLCSAGSAICCLYFSCCYAYSSIFFWLLAKLAGCFVLSWFPLSAFAVTETERIPRSDDQPEPISIGTLWAPSRKRENHQINPLPKHTHTHIYSIYKEKERNMECIDAGRLESCKYVIGLNYPSARERRKKKVRPSLNTLSPRSAATVAAGLPMPDRQREEIVSRRTRREREKKERKWK